MKIKPLSTIRINTLSSTTCINTLLSTTRINTLLSTTCTNSKQMVSIYRNLGRVGAIIAVPYLLMMLFIIGYLARGKHKVWIKIKNVPFSTILEVDLSKVKQNLVIETMMYNFLLTLSVLEFTTNIFWVLREVYEFDLNHNYSTNPNKLETSKTQDVAHVQLRFPLIYIYMILQSTIVTVMCQFLIVLRRAYISLPYNKWNIGYTLVIVFRSFLLFALYSFAQTIYLANMLFFAFSLTDCCVYIPSCKSFYLLLKGRSLEARWHSTQSDYRNKRLIAKQYFYAQMITIAMGLLLLINYSILFIQAILLIVSRDPMYTGINLLMIFPKFTVSSSVGSIIHSLLYRSIGMQWIVTIIFYFILFLSYAMVCLAIIVKIVIKRKRYNNVNNWATKSLMQEYKDTFDTPYRNYQQRPPFIQAFRSHNNFVY